MCVCVRCSLSMRSRHSRWYSQGMHICMDVTGMCVCMHVCFGCEFRCVYVCVCMHVCIVRTHAFMLCDFGYNKVTQKQYYKGMYHQERMQLLRHGYTHTHTHTHTHTYQGPALLTKPSECIHTSYRMMAIMRLHNECDTESHTHTRISGTGPPHQAFKWLSSAYPMSATRISQKTYHRLPPHVKHG